MADPRQSLAQDESQNRPLGPDPRNPHAENFKWLNRAHRGHFATSLYASLSRSQTDFGGPSTFGLEVTRYPFAYDKDIPERTPEQLEAQAKKTKKETFGVKNGSSFALGNMIDRGCFNYRYPVTEYYLELHPYQQAIEDGKQAAIEKAKKEALAIAQKKAIEDANRAQIQASSLPTNAENSEGLRPGVNAKDGPPREETGSGSNDPTGPPQNGQIMTSGPTDTGTTSTQPQAAEAPPTEDPNAQNPEKKDTEPEERGKVVGTCQMFSCAMGKWFYQILRVEELRGPDYDFEMSFPADSQIVLTFGGPVWFQSFNDGEHDLVGGEGTRYPSASPHQTRMKPKDSDSEEGGEREEKVIDVHSTKPKTKTMAYWVKNKDKENLVGETVVDNKGRGLEAQIYQYHPDANGGKGEYEQLDLVKSRWEADNGPDSTGLTAYNAHGRLEKVDATPFGQCKRPRSATFVAVIRLVEGQAHELAGWTEQPPHPQTFYEHIGVDPLCDSATGAMWERIFLSPLTVGAGLEPVLNLAEFNIIGRSLEKILQVDMIPAAFEDDTPDEAHPNETNHKLKYLALVSNLFVKANVDLKAMFWKIRFLIRVHKFLSDTLIKSPPKGARDKDKGKETNKRKGAESREQSQQVGGVQQVDPIEKAQEDCIKNQMNRIKSSIERIVRYLAKALLEPLLNGKPRTSLMPDYKVPRESNYYYVMMTIWYVWKYFHQVDPAWRFDWTDQLGKGEDSVLLGPRRLPPDEWTFARSDRDKVQLLQWFHYGSLLKLCKKGILDNWWEGEGHDLELLEYKVRKLANAAKMVSSAKLSSRKPYVADDEIFDRLSFVSDELDLENLEPTDNGVITLLSMKRVKGRDYTRTLNPGWLPNNMEGSTSGPWEIHALCHHSRLVVLTKEEKTRQSLRTREHTHSEAEGFRQNICNFLNAEGTLIPCWERAHAKYRKGWLRSEATSVVATTLVIILERILELASPIAGDGEDTSAGDDASTKSPTDGTKPEWPQTLATFAERSMDHEKRIVQEVIHLGGLMKGQLNAFERFTNESGQQPPIVWKSFRPPLTYHPTSFTDSIEDKPDLYKYQVLRKRPMPLSLSEGIIERPDAVGRNKRDFDREDINKIFRDEDMRDLLFIVDIKAARNEEDNEGFTWVIKDYQYKKFDECEDADERKKKVDKNTEALKWALYDSLVDQEVQHRFHNVKPLRKPKERTKIPKEILELLVYVVHPESAACLGDHIRDILNFSRFSSQTGDTWVASITLRGWRVHTEDEINKARGVELTDLKRQNSADDFYLPRNLMQVWENVVGLSKQTSFKPEAASIILSTNSFGDFSKCTVVAEFIDPEKMTILATKARKVWQRFIHQPQTGRCLVFFLLLGNMCEALTTQYTEAIKILSDLLIIDGTFTKTVDDYPQKYELGVWSLDALYKLQSSLNATVASLLKAKLELKAQIIAGPGQRSVKLERLCQAYLSKFEDNLVQLTAVNVELNRKIELNTRNKDATSAILAMRDSRTAISQNSTVQRLTYLTIGYLPVALMAALFTIPKEMNVLFVPKMADHGRSWFVGAIFLISFFTYTLAVYIGAILKFLQNFFQYPAPVPGGKSKSKKKDPNKLPLNFWRETGVERGLIWMKKNWLMIVKNWFHGDRQENKKEKEKKGMFTLLGAWRNKKEGEAKEKTRTDVASAAEQGLLGGGAGVEKGTSTEGSEQMKEPATSQNEAPGTT